MWPCRPVSPSVPASVRLLCDILWTVSLMNVATAVENCTQVQMKCMQRLGCGMALQNYMLNCGELIHGQTHTCHSRCRKALISLLSTEDQGGEAFMTCDCQGNEVCTRQRERLEVCSNDVMDALAGIYDDTTQITCSLAELICNADTLCFTALDYYHRHCRKLFQGEKCTHRCNNSLNILYRQTKARKLQTCQCDGTEDYNCPQLRHNTHRMCFGTEWGGGTTVRVRHPSRHNHTRPPSPTHPYQVGPDPEGPDHLDPDHDSGEDYAEEDPSVVSQLPRPQSDSQSLRAQARVWTAALLLWIIATHRYQASRQL